MQIPDSTATAFRHGCPLFDAPPTAAETAAYKAATAASYVSGIPPEERPDRPAYDSGVLTVVLATFLLVALSVKAGNRLWKSFFDDIFTVRRRNNAFDQQTAGEAWMITAMLIQTCIYEGLLTFSLLQWQGYTQPGHAFPLIAALIGTAAALLAFQSAAYRTIGYAFAPDRQATAQWLRGFNASQSALGFMLIIPALGALFYPDAAMWLLITAGVLYLTFRGLFISKGFRIFHTGPASLFYFFLYLCAVEITPVILAYAGSIALCIIVR